ncbi:MAG: triose-phosphate isomerase [Buchnera aphidicola (Nurudea shiraii)]
MQEKIIIANWKLNGSMTLLHNLLKPIANFVNLNELHLKLIIALPFIYLYPALNIVMNKNVIIGAQDVDIHSYGAFTGETSINMLNDIHVQYVIIGHSERRLYHRESNDLIAKKFKIVKKFGLTPILCIGESENDSNLLKIEKICQSQINPIIDLLGKKAFNNSIIAYEPIWAIGSGRIPSLNYIKNTCDLIKNYVLKRQNIDEKSLSVQYGGSVDENNVREICQISSINGVLVGSASLFLSRFLKILSIVSMENEKLR